MNPRLDCMYTPNPYRLCAASKKPGSPWYLFYEQHESNEIPVKAMEVYAKEKRR
jgi:hypothetical protein